MDRRKISFEIEVEEYADNNKIIEAVREWVIKNFSKPETATILVETISKEDNPIIR